MTCPPCRRVSIHSGRDGAGWASAGRDHSASTRDAQRTVRITMDASLSVVRRRAARAGVLPQAKLRRLILSRELPHLLLVELVDVVDEVVGDEVGGLGGLLDDAVLQEEVEIGLVVGFR